MDRCARRLNVVTVAGATRVLALISWATRGAGERELLAGRTGDGRGRKLGAIPAFQARVSLVVERPALPIRPAQSLSREGCPWPRAPGRDEQRQRVM